MNITMRLRLIILTLLLVALAGCSRTDKPEQVAAFCERLHQVNAGAIDTGELRELAGHARIIEALLEVSPPSLEQELIRIHRTIDDWAGAINGDRPMIDTFKQLSAPQLVGSEGRVTDFIAANCGIELDAPSWVEAAEEQQAMICPGWPRVGTHLNFNYFPNLPDIAGSNYFSNTFLMSRWAHLLGVDTLRDAFVVEPGGKVVFQGQYPRTRYFAYHPNDMDLNNLDTLRDVELQPDPDSENPFLEPQTAEQQNFYTATLQFSPPPANPEANTSYVGESVNGETNRFVMNLLRLYHVDEGNVASSGAVPLPAVSIYNASGELEQHFPACDIFAKGADIISSKRRFPALPVLDHRARPTPLWSTSSNFDAPSDTLANADVQYLSTLYSSRFGELLVVRGKYLSAPDTRNGESPALQKQVRLYNLCNYNFWNGSAINCLLDNQLQRDEDGYYTLVIASEQLRPNNLETHSATWMDWGPYLDGQLSFRFVYRENPLVQAIAAGLRGEPVAPERTPYVPRAVHCQKSDFEKDGWRACFDAADRQG
ncbi:MAG: hypothetical protein ABJL54_06510 [Halioglobus sp.]